METNIDPATGVVVKSDQTGRIRYTPEYKRKVLAAFESSSLSATVFAKQCGIKYPTLEAWIEARKRDDQIASQGNTPAFLVAEVASSANRPALEAQLLCGAVVRTSDVEQIRLLAALARNHLGLDPFNGAASLFTNKYPRLIKIFYFNGTGYWLVAKRLEEGTFTWSQDIEGDRRKLLCSWHDHLADRLQPLYQLTPVSCLIHITQKFKEAPDERPRIAARILILTGGTYQIEKRLREKNPPLSIGSALGGSNQGNPTIIYQNSSVGSAASARSRPEAC